MKKCILIVLSSFFFIKRWSEQRRSSLDVVKQSADHTCSPFVIMRQGTETSQNTVFKKNETKQVFLLYWLVDHGNIHLTMWLLFYCCRGNPNEKPYLRGGICNNCTAGYSCDIKTDGLCFVPCWSCLKMWFTSWINTKHIAFDYYNFMAIYLKSILRLVLKFQSLWF